MNKKGQIEDYFGGMFVLLILVAFILFIVHEIAERDAKEFKYGDCAHIEDGFYGNDSGFIEGIQKRFIFEDKYVMRGKDKKWIEKSSRFNKFPCPKVTVTASVVENGTSVNSTNLYIIKEEGK